MWFCSKMHDTPLGFNNGKERHVVLLANRESVCPLSFYNMVRIITFSTP